MSVFGSPRSGLQERSFNEAALAELGLCDTQPAETGVSVAIGFVDYGFDLLHPCFLASSKRPASRFRYFWDQNREASLASKSDLNPALVEDWDGDFLDQAVDAAVRSGSRRELDALYDPHANNCGRHGTVGGAHATMMASMAAGTAFAGFRSPAPFADLIGVQLALPYTGWKEQDGRGVPTWAGADLPRRGEWSGWRSYDAAPQIMNAISYIYDRACQLGVEVLVINLSIGAWAGAHDGRSPVEAGIADVLTQADRAWRKGRGPRTVIVTGAGNAGADEGHWTGEIGPGQRQVFQWTIQRADPTQNKLEVWYQRTSPIEAELCSPDGGSVGIAAGGTCELISSHRRFGIADHITGARGDLSRLRILVHPPFMHERCFAGASDTAAFEVRLSVDAGPAVTAHAWVERDDGASERSWLAPSHPEGTLCCLATAPGAIVVGGYDHRGLAIARDHAVLPASSMGPAPWRTGHAARIPHFAVPATGIWGARSKTRGFTQTAGTSAAVALASGAIANALARDIHAQLLPKDLGQQWNPRFGYGPLSMSRRVRSGAYA